jgi:SAM-dependent methyltransferase
MMNAPDSSDKYEVTAAFYDHIVPYRTRPDVDFFVNAARQVGGDVLELGSGTGRVLIPTARSGITITGLDSAPAMLAICRQRLLEEPEAVQSRVKLVQGDMRDFDLGVSFSLVTLPFRPFQHLLTVTDQLACLDSIHRHLVEGGKLILDVFNPSLASLVQDDLGQEKGDEPEFTLPDGRRVLRTYRTTARDIVNQVNYVELIYNVFHPDGQQERHVDAFPMRYFFRYEVEHLLYRSGFEVEAVYSEYDRSPFGAKYPGELLFVARRA